MSQLVLGSKGSAVIAAKRRLNGENRFNIDTFSANHVGPNYGPRAVVATRRMKYLLGYPVGDIDGAYGDELDSYLTGKRLSAGFAMRRQNRVAIEKFSTARSRVVQIAASQVGYVEGANNHNKYGVAYGMDNVAWCAEFQSWVFTQAGFKLHYAFVPFIVQDARARKNGLAPVGPEKVALACLDWEGDGTADHVALVVAVHRDRGVVATIEGNTSDADFSNGGMVMRRERPISQVQQFVRVTKKAVA